MDVLFINPSIGENYQSLKSDYSAVEPPTWSLLLAEAMRSMGYKVSIVDANAENLSNEEIYSRIKVLKPRLISFVVYLRNLLS